MSTKLFDLKKQREEALNRADVILKSAESGKRALAAHESVALDAIMSEVHALDPQIKAIEDRNTIFKAFPNGASLATVGQSTARGFEQSKSQKKELSADYGNAFMQYVRTSGKEITAALYEGSDSAGGYAVPIVVDDQIVPLAPQEMAVRRVALVIPTVSDIKIPTKTAFSTASAKAETSSFTESEPTLGQFTLSAYMAGVLQEISWELAQDVPAFQAFAVDDMILAQQMYEENLYVNGTGSGQAQGLIGNVGAGYGPQELDSNNNTVTIAGLLNTICTLNEAYHPNASWLMSRETSVIIRKAQMQSNLFFPAFIREGKQDLLFGYPVNYSAYMPAAIRGNTPVLFGDFRRGYVIGDRGGSGINVKVLDQPLASQGLLQLLAYRRTDGRVRRSEAIQSYVVAAS